MKLKLDRTLARIDAWGLYIIWFLIRSTEPIGSGVAFIAASVLFLFSILWNDEIDAKEIVIIKDKNKEE